MFNINTSLCFPILFSEVVWCLRAIELVRWDLRRFYNHDNYNIESVLGRIKVNEGRWGVEGRRVNMLTFCWRVSTPTVETFGRILSLLACWERDLMHMRKSYHYMANGSGLNSWRKLLFMNLSYYVHAHSAILLPRSKYLYYCAIDFLHFVFNIGSGICPALRDNDLL